MGAVQNFNSDFVGANSSSIYVTALGGWTALSCQAQMGERRDKNCSYYTRHSGQDFCSFGMLTQEKLHYSFGTFAPKTQLLLGTFTQRKMHMYASCTSKHKNLHYSFSTFTQNKPHYFFGTFKRKKLHDLKLTCERACRRSIVYSRPEPTDDIRNIHG
jgi:hypothetical protein